MTVFKFPKRVNQSVVQSLGAPAALAPFPISRTPAVEAVVDRMAQHKLQKPARAELRAAWKATAKHLRTLGVADELIQRELLAFAGAVRVRLDQRKRRRLAGAAEQIMEQAVRVGEHRAAAALLTAMPRLPPIAPHLRVRFPNKVALHPTWWLHRSRDVGSYADFVVRERYAAVAELHLQQSGNAVRYFLKSLFLDDETIDRHARGFEARVRAEVWRRVLLDHDPHRKADDKSDRGK